MDTQKVLDDLGRAFEAFKEKNDAAINELKAKGAPSAETQAAVDKANADITALQAKLGDIEKAGAEAKREIARLEALGRPAAEATEDEQVHVRTFHAQVLRQPIEGRVSAEHVEALRTYRSAFAAWMRRGPSSGPAILNSLSVGSDPDGGYWVPPDTTGRVVELMRETSPMRQVADVQPISSDRLEGINDLGEASSGWVSEQGARTATNTPQIGKWEIPVHEQYAFPQTTQKLLDDAVVDVEGWLARKIADILARTENTAFVTGNGVGKPRGFTTHTVSASAPSASTWAVIQRYLTGVSAGFHAAGATPNGPGDVLVDTVFGLKPMYRAGAAWAMTRGTLATVRKLKDGQGNYLWQPNFQQLGASTLLGFPVLEFEDMAAIAADSLSIAFANWRAAYQVADRLGMRTLRDPFTNKPYVGFYSTKRVGGDVVNFEAIKIVKFGTA